MEGDTGKEGEMGIEGEEGRRCFPLAETLAFILLGSIRPSHILETVFSTTLTELTPFGPKCDAKSDATSMN